MTVSYYSTISLVFSISKVGSLIEDVSASGSCRDTIILGAANTYYLIKNKDNIDLKTSKMVLEKRCT